GNRPPGMGASSAEGRAGARREPHVLPGAFVLPAKPPMNTPARMVSAAVGAGDRGSRTTRAGQSEPGDQPWLVDGGSPTSFSRRHGPARGGSGARPGQEDTLLTWKTRLPAEWG